MATCLIYISLIFLPFPPSSLSYPLSLPSLPPEFPPPPWECDRSHSLLCCIAFARGHRKTAENLCRYSRPFTRVCPQSNSLWKITSRSVFRCAGRGPAVTHPSTDPAKSCLTWVDRLAPDNYHTSNTVDVNVLYLISYNIILNPENISVISFLLL